MNEPDKLLSRLNEIGQSLESTGTALALIGLGSVGLEMERIDVYSDLDFFAIVRPGYKKAYLADLSWLSSPCPIAYHFQNTVDGYKLLYEDGIFAEFAVFEPQELDAIPFAPGRFVWAAEGVDPAIRIPRLPIPAPNPHSIEWVVGEGLTNLYVGLGRYRRGEKLAAMRLIQGSAVDRLLDLVAMLDPKPPDLRDSFTPERRLEVRYPHLAAELSQWLQGYDSSPQSAYSILKFLEARVEVNEKMKARILELIGEDLDS